MAVKGRHKEEPRRDENLRFVGPVIGLYGLVMLLTGWCVGWLMFG